MNNLFTFIIGVYVLICPFYLFESGVPQPAHYVAGIAFIMMAFSKDFRSILKDKIVLYLFLFVLLTFVINLGYYFKYNTEDGGVEFLFHSAYYIFNFLFFLLFLKTIQQKPATSTVEIQITPDSDLDGLTSKLSHHLKKHGANREKYCG